jgi:molecular chaperone GrpE
MNHSHPPDEFDDNGADSAADAAMNAAEQELGALEQQIAAAQEEVLRTRAEMDNLRKRLARETETIRRYAGERILADLLPVIDSLEQGLTIVGDPGPAREGLELTYKQLTGTLERHALLPIDPAGLAFDPAEHQAISLQPTDAHPENTVLTVLQKGYRLHDRVLRPAMVIVSKAPEGA